MEKIIVVLWITFGIYHALFKHKYDKTHFLKSKL